ncbi:MAG: hypothetical protein KA028_02590 [Candidatus Pacebacteria bacterium]|nr:hypothetical protein [Candidatus Paceibacterota bacterium]
MNQNDYYDAKLRSLTDVEARLHPRNTSLPENPKHIHISGVCGTAMGALAGLLKEKYGAEVSITGSDKACYSPMSTVLADLGIVSEPFSKEHIEKADVVIVGNSIWPMNEEAEAVRALNKPAISLPEALQSFFIKGKKSLVVTGTHGKTTTSGLLAHVLMSTGADPSYMIGGVPQDGSPQYRNGKGEHFVLEGDEYDSAYFDKRPKFLHYSPWGAIINAIEYDHADIYASLDAYIIAFKHLIEIMPADGVVVAWGGQELVREVCKDAKNKVVYFDVNAEADIYGNVIEQIPQGQKIKIFEEGKEIGDILFPMYGAYNARNALAVYALLRNAGFDYENIKKGLESFKGMKRRQEIVANKNSIVLIDDFAHHPTAVVETLIGIRDHYTNNRIIACFEPRSNSSRKKYFEEAYTTAFSDADIAYISMPAFKEGDSKDDLINGKELAAGISKNINSKGTAIDATCFDTAGDLFETLKSNIKSGDVIVLMSNGSFEGLREKVQAEIISLG